MCWVHSTQLSKWWMNNLISFISCWRDTFQCIELSFLLLCYNDNFNFNENFIFKTTLFDDSFKHMTPPNQKYHFLIHIVLPLREMKYVDYMSLLVHRKYCQFTDYAAGFTTLSCSYLVMGEWLKMICQYTLKWAYVYKFSTENNIFFYFIIVFAGKWQELSL